MHLRMYNGRFYRAPGGKNHRVICFFQHQLNSQLCFAAARRDDAQSSGPPRLYLIWRKFHASSFHLFRGKSGKSNHEKVQFCPGTSSLQDSFGRKLSFLLVYTFFFSWPPLMKRQTRNSMLIVKAPCACHKVPKENWAFQRILQLLQVSQ